MRGTVRRRGAGWEYQVDVGNQPAQRCPNPDCGQGRTWLVEERHERCPWCGGQLEQRVERRLQSRAGFRTKREAQAALREVISAVEGGTRVAPTRQTVSDYLTAWLAAHASQVKASTLASYRHSIERYVIPHIGGVQVQQLTPARLTAMYAELAASGGKNGAPLSRRTVAYFHAIVRKALTDGVDADVLPRNPAAKAKLPRVDQRADPLASPTSASQRKLSVWSADQVRSFVAYVVEDRLAALYVTALGTGLRRGELLGLRWEDVDLDTGRISVRQALVLAGGQPRLETPKTPNSRRTFAVDTAVRDALRQHRKAQVEDRLRWGSGYEDRGLVFARENGTPLDPDGVSKAFTRTLGAAGLPVIRFHDLRHTHASLALAAGVPVTVVSKRLGHSTIAITVDTYAHLIPDEDVAAAQTFGVHVWGTAR